MLIDTLWQCMKQVLPNIDTKCLEVFRNKKKS